MIFDWFGKTVDTDTWTGNLWDIGNPNAVRAPGDPKINTEYGDTRAQISPPPGHSTPYGEAYQRNPNDPFSLLPGGRAFWQDDVRAEQANETRREAILDRLRQGTMTPDEAMAMGDNMIDYEEAYGNYRSPWANTDVSQETKNAWSQNNKLATYNSLSTDKKDAALGNIQAAMASVKGVTDAFMGDISKFEEKWDSKLADFENLTADAALGDISGIEESFNQASMKLDMMADQGVPADQIAGQKLQLEMRKTEAKGNAVRQYRVAHNNKVADINAALTNTYGQLLSQLGQLRWGEQNTTAQLHMARANIESAYYEELRLNVAYDEYMRLQAGPGAQGPPQAIKA